MSTVAFDLNTSSPLTITANIVYGTDWWYERLNQWEQRTADGTDVVTDAGPNKIRGVLILKNISKAHGDSLRTWLYNTAIFAKNPIRITPPAGVDLGGGDATALVCRLDMGQNIKGCLELVPPGNYNAKINYRT